MGIPPSFREGDGGGVGGRKRRRGRGWERDGELSGRQKKRQEQRSGGKTVN